jgi:hypothetical protein
MHKGDWLAFSAGQTGIRRAGERPYTVSIWPELSDLLDWPTLERLAALVPSRRSGSAAKRDRAARGDDSRSGIAFRKGCALKRAGKTFEEMAEALLADPETADWVREKGLAYGGRELQRIWNRAHGTAEWLAHCTRSEKARPHSNLDNAMVALREAYLGLKDGAGKL